MYTSKTLNILGHILVILACVKDYFFFGKFCAFSSHLIMYSFLQRYLEQFAANLDGLITYLQESLNKCMIGAVLFSLD